MPISNAETAKAMDEASSDGLFTLAQTGGMMRRQDRRDARQDCRQQEGAIGADKRNCKQGRRQQRLNKSRFSAGGGAGSPMCRSERNAANQFSAGGLASSRSFALAAWRLGAEMRELRRLMQALREE
jgi:hypothetical protein